MLSKLSKIIGVVVTTLVLTSAAQPEAKQPESQDPNKIILTKDNTVSLSGEVSDASAAQVVLKARELDSKLPSGYPIYLVMSTPGGSIDAGLEMIDNLKTLNRPVHTVTLFAASMGFQTAQGLGTRYVSPTGTLMSHKARGGLSGEFPGQFDSRYGYYLKRVLKLDEVVVARSSGKQTLAGYRAAYANELWCQGQECVDIGVADKSVQVACDKSLDGVQKDQVSLSFLGMEIKLDVTRAACPTITGILEVDAKSNGKKLNLADPYSMKYDFPFLANPDTAKQLQDAINKKIEQIDGTKRAPKGY